MRISNIRQYLGGANNVIAREVIEGDQLGFQLRIPGQDFTAYTFEVNTQVLNSTMSTRGSNVTINSLTPKTDNLVNNGTFNYSTGQTFEAVKKNPNDNSRLNLYIPSTLLSDVTTDHTPIDTDSPLIVAMNVTMNSNTSPNVKESFRLLLIMRYRPFNT